MTPFRRGEAPAVLVELGPDATASFVARRAKDPAAAFFWPKRGGRSILPLVRDALVVLTADHCSYCDGFPIDATGEKEVDHFRPKRDFPGESFDWHNLFLVCTACNKAKLDEWNEHLLRPDAPDYAFERYFWIDALTGELTPSPTASAAEQVRAKETIRVFGLMRSGLCMARRKAIRATTSSLSTPKADLPFRFLF